MNGQTWFKLPSLPHQISYHSKSNSRYMYTVLKVQQDLNKNFENRVRNVWVLQKFVGRVKKKTVWRVQKT